MSVNVKIKQKSHLIVQKLPIGLIREANGIYLVIIKHFNGIEQIQLVPPVFYKYIFSTLYSTCILQFGPSIQFEILLILHLNTAQFDRVFL